MLNLALVGFGRWGTVLVDSVNGKSPLVKFSTIVSRSPERVASAAQERALEIRGKLEDVLADDAIDGIVLATPHSQHADEIIACAAAGKSVFVEKPVTLTQDSAEKAFRAARDAGILVAAGHNRRFLPAVSAIKDMIDAGKLGEVLHVESNYSGNVAGKYAPDLWRVAPGESPAGGMAGAGIHLIDAIIHFAGPISGATAISARRVLDVPLDDTTSAMFTLTSGASASLTTIMATASTFRMQVFGTAGTVELRGNDRLEFTSLDGTMQPQVFAAVDIERAELEAFADGIAGRAPYPVPAEEVINGVAAFEAVGRSAAGGGYVGIA